MTELSLNIGNYNREERYDDKVAIALHILNIILSERGKGHPNFPNIGVGIENFEFSRNNPSELDKIKTKISEEVNRVLPDLEVEGLEIKIEKDSLNMDFLNVELKVSYMIDNNQNDVRLKYEFHKVNNIVIPKIFI
jgi:hypothetical protein